MHPLIRYVIVLAAVPVLTTAVHAQKSAPPDRNAQARAVMKASFQAKGQAGMDRLDQDKTQAVCSLHAPAAPPADATAKVLAANQAMIKPPSDGKYLGDWKRGQAIAEEGTGEQYSDDPKKPSGGNCYACHELDKQQIAYGTIGPSLYHYGKNRGQSEPILKLTWNMIYDMKGYAVCTAMPRFGSKGILTEQQIKDVMALLFDPDSPVNK